MGVVWLGIVDNFIRSLRGRGQVSLAVKRCEFDLEHVEKKINSCCCLLCTWAMLLEGRLQSCTIRQPKEGPWGIVQGFALLDNCICQGIFPN